MTVTEKIEEAICEQLKAHGWDLGAIPSANVAGMAERIEKALFGERGSPPNRNLTRFDPIPCGCLYNECPDWHVTHVAQVQGVHFTEVQARAVAGFLNFVEYGQLEYWANLFNYAVEERRKRGNG